RSSATLAFADAALADRVNRAGHVPAEAEPLPRGGEPDLQGRAARRGHVHRGSPRPQATAIRTCPGPGSGVGTSTSSIASGSAHRTRRWDDHAHGPGAPRGGGAPLPRLPRLLPGAPAAGPDRRQMGHARALGTGRRPAAVLGPEPPHRGRQPEDAHPDAALAGARRAGQPVGHPVGAGSRRLRPHAARHHAHAPARAHQGVGRAAHGRGGGGPRRLRPGHRRASPLNTVTATRTSTAKPASEVTATPAVNAAWADSSSSPAGRPVSRRATPTAPPSVSRAVAANDGPTLLGTSTPARYTADSTLPSTAVPSTAPTSYAVSDTAEADAARSVGAADRIASFVIVSDRPIPAPTSTLAASSTTTASSPASSVHSRYPAAASSSPAGTRARTG